MRHGLVELRWEHRYSESKRYGTPDNRYRFRFDRNALIFVEAIKRLGAVSAGRHPKKRQAVSVEHLFPFLAQSFGRFVFKNQSRHAEDRSAIMRAALVEISLEFDHYDCPFPKRKSTLYGFTAHFHAVPPSCSPLP